MMTYGMRSKIDGSIVLLFLLFCGLHRYSQAQPFQKRYTNNAFYSIVQQSPGEFLIAGSESEAGIEVRLGKYNNKGVALNTFAMKLPTGSSSVSVHTMRNILCLDGDSLLMPLYKVQSATDPYSLGGIVKIDTGLNNIGWLKRYQTGLVNTNSQTTLMAAMRTRASAHYVMVGWTNPGFMGPYQYYHGAYILKTNLQGQIVWTKHLMEAFDSFQGVCEAPNGDYIMAGNTVFSPRVMNIDPSGTVKWLYLYSINGKGGQQTGILPTSDGGYLLVGTVLYNGFVMKLNASGQLVWATEVGGTPGTSRLSKAYETSDGDFIVVGTTEIQSHGGSDGWVLRVSASGQLVWSKVYGTSANESLNDLVIEDGMLYAVGVADGQGWIVSADAETGELGCGEKTTTPVVYDRTATTVVTTATYNQYSTSVVYNGSATTSTPTSTSGELCILLPVNLVSFTGQAKPEGNVLQWQTSYESNNKFFVIERSPDGLQWSAIGTVEGKQHSTVLREYSFVDRETAPHKTTYYYRLRQTDEDGTSTWSSAIRIHREENTEWQFSLYPQPAGEAVRVEVFAEAAGYEIELWTIEGKLVLQTSFDQSEKEVDLKNLPAGVYLLKLRSQGEVKGIRKFVKN